MTIKQENITLSSLGETGAALVLEKNISAKLPVDDWLRLLRRVAKFDRQTNDRLTRTKTHMGIGIAILFISLFLSLFIGIKVLTGGVVIVAIVFAIYIIIQFKKLGKTDVSDQLIDFVVPFLEMIKDDLSKKAEIHLDLDLQLLKSRQADSKEKHKGKGYPKITTEFFAIPWLGLDTKLVDKTRLQLYVVDNVRKLKVTKRNARGNKIKTKIKWKSKRCVSAHVSVDEKRYQVIEKSIIDTKNSGIKTSVKSKKTSAIIRVQFNEKFSDYCSVETEKVLRLIASGLSMLERKRQESQHEV